MIPQISIDKKILLTVEEAMEYSGLSRHTLTEYMETDRRLPCLKRGRKIFIDREGLISFLRKKAEEREGWFQWNEIIK